MSTKTKWKEKNMVVIMKEHPVKQIWFIVILLCFLTIAQPIQANPFSAFSDALEIAGQLNRIKTPSNTPMGLSSQLEARKEYGVHWKVSVWDGAIVVKGKTIWLTPSERSTLTDIGATGEQVVAVYNRILSKADKSLAKLSYLSDGNVSINGLDIALIKLIYAHDQVSSIWHLEVLEHNQALFNPSSSAAEIVKLYNDLIMPDDIELILNPDAKVTIKGIEGMDFQLKWSESYWKLEPKGVFEQVNNPLLSYAQAWSIYKNCLLNQGEGMKTVVDFLNQKESQVYFTDGYLSFGWCELRFEGAWLSEQHTDLIAFSEVIPLIVGNQTTQAKAQLEKLKANYMRFMVGVLSIRDGDLKQASAIANKLLQRYPNSYFAGLLQASVDLEQKRYSAVLSRCDGLFKLYQLQYPSGVYECQALKACALEGLGKRQEALSFYRRAVELNPEIGDLNKLENEDGRMAAGFRTLMGTLEKANHEGLNHGI